MTMRYTNRRLSYLPRFNQGVCPAMAGHPRFNQIISNSNWTVAYLLTMSIQNSTFDTNKWLIVDIITKGMIFSSKCTIKCLAVGLCRNPPGAHITPTDSLAAFREWDPQRGREGGERERSGQGKEEILLQTDHPHCYNIKIVWFYLLLHIITALRLLVGHQLINSNLQRLPWRPVWNDRLTKVNLKKS